MKRLTALWCVLCVTGCASIIHGSSESIDVHSEVPGASIYLNNQKIGTGNASVSIPKKQLSSSVLRASKPGCDDAAKAIETSFDATSLLGILIDWGIISIIGVDWLGTGAIHHAQQTSYILNPNCHKG